MESDNYIEVDEASIASAVYLQIRSFCVRFIEETDENHDWFDEPNDLSHFMQDLFPEYNGPITTDITGQPCYNLMH